MRAAIAVRADVNNKGTGVDGDLVSAKIKDDVERASLCHRLRVLQSACAWRKAQIQRANTRRRRMKDAKAIPALTHAAKLLRRFGGERQDCAAIGARQRTLPDKHKQFANGLRRLDKLHERLCASAGVIIIIGQICLRADKRDRQLARQPSLADTSV